MTVRELIDELLAEAPSLDALITVAHEALEYTAEQVDGLRMMTIDGQPVVVIEWGDGVGTNVWFDRPEAPT